MRPLVIGLAGMTHSCPEPQRFLNLVTKEWGWEVLMEGGIGSDLERLWHIAPGSAGDRFWIVRAPGSDHGMVRVVRGSERRRVRERAARWAGFEIIVTSDIVGLHRRLANHPDFKPYQAPVDYDFTHAASNLHQAFSSRLPGGTHVTMTMGVTQPKKRKFPTAKTQVGQFFQVPLNTPQYARCRAFYEETLGMEVTLESGGTHGPIHKAWKVPPGPMYFLDIVKGDAPDSGRGCIEIHGLPAGFIDDDPADPMHFDGGTCMATLGARDFDGLYRAVTSHRLARIPTEPGPIAAAPYGGRRAFCFTGPDAERVEVIEAMWV
ncbi:MAG: VOC family protein [Alphaproteobacteria bacterium]|nr:VOC family protein [Alphaproteobacteria bacterium]